MLGVLRLLAGNAARKPVTIPFPGQVPVPDGLRGWVRITPDHCLACGVCSYVCVSDAITGTEEDGGYLWRYDPGRCTFCARCAERCPGRALALDSEPPPSYRSAGALATATQVPYPLCPECGQAARNIPEEWLAKAFAQADPGTRELLRLCVRCRRRRTQQAMKVSTGGGR